MQPTFKKGKKIVGDKVIDAVHRLTFYASDGCTINTATLWADGTTSCNCMGWRFRKSCKHAARAHFLTANVDETGEGRTPAAPEDVPRGTRPAGPRIRSVDT